MCPPFLNLISDVVKLVAITAINMAGDIYNQAKVKTKPREKGHVKAPRQSLTVEVVSCGTSASSVQHLHSMV